mmetsp:Transcript_493/g.1496  ORF Transcript_493/g.1496 Transcript_493/m.1496 type:complete len:201 (-) Transcript_493:592-1194(-)
MSATDLCKVIALSICSKKAFVLLCLICSVLLVEVSMCLKSSSCNATKTAWRFAWLALFSSRAAWQASNCLLCFSSSSSKSFSCLLHRPLRSLSASPSSWKCLIPFLTSMKSSLKPSTILRRASWSRWRSARMFLRSVDPDATCRSSCLRARPSSSTELRSRSSSQRRPSTSSRSLLSASMRVVATVEASSKSPCFLCKGP